MSSLKNGITAFAYAKAWRQFDAKEQVLGRLATKISKILQGKHKADCGDYVIVTNAKHIIVTGNKYEKKEYISHTGTPGGLKVRKYKDVFEKDPTVVIRKAVFGMLPKNALRNDRMARLRVFTGEEHPYKQNILIDYEKQMWNAEPMKAETIKQ